MSNQPHAAILAAIAATKPSAFQAKLAELRQLATARFKHVQIEVIDHKPVGALTRSIHQFGAETIETTDGNPRQGRRDRDYTYVDDGTYIVISHIREVIETNDHLALPGHESLFDGIDVRLEPVRSYRERFVTIKVRSNCDFDALRQALAELSI